MSEVRVVPLESMGFGFSPGADDFSRPWPFGSSEEDWRPLTEREITVLEDRGNRADSWANILVTAGFSAEFIRDCRFFGPVRISALRAGALECNDLRLPVGLYSSTIVACDLAANIAVHRVGYLAHMCVEERCILFNIDEALTTNHAKFGNGLIMEGEDEEVRIWLEIANENGGRKVLPFEGMLPADAWIWSKFRDDGELLDRFAEMTSRSVSPPPGGRGIIGSGSVVKDCRILKDVRIGKSAYLKGCNKIKNLTIRSEPERPTQIGEGCELVNGIIGYGCRVFYGVKAVRFVLCDSSSLKYGARLINSVLGPNSTVSCCEVLNSLLFGSHEQHHNSSFLCASVMKGMSNMASGASVGSNHNSRAADGEIIADRGFWPGLNVSLRHNSRFAAFCIIAKGSYPAELNVPLPFSLLSNDEQSGELKLMPGYWFRYNMYALARNSAKTAARDARGGERQQLEYDWLAPDTADQMLLGRRILEDWARLSDHLADGKFPSARALLEVPESPDIFAGGDNLVESGGRRVRVLHAGRAWRDYRTMIRFYAVRVLLETGGMAALRLGLASPRRPGGQAPPADSWENVGGQLMLKSTLERIKSGVKSREIGTWTEVHQAYRRAEGDYGRERADHAARLLSECSADGETPEALADEAVRTARFVFEGIRASRLKDYQDEFRNGVYDSDAERDAVLGPFRENPFIAQAKDELTRFEQLVRRARREHSE